MTARTATEGARFELREFYVHALSFTYWIIAILKAATVRTEETTLCLSLVDKVKKNTALSNTPKYSIVSILDVK